MDTQIFYSIFGMGRYEMRSIGNLFLDSKVNALHFGVYYPVVKTPFFIQWNTENCKFVILVKR